MSAENEVNTLAMSDDDFLNASHEPVTPAPVENAEEIAPVESAAAEEAPAVEPENPAEPAPSDEIPPAPADNGEATDANPEKAADPAAKAEAPAENPADKATDAPAVNYQAEYERIMAPFKANGRDVTVKSVDDAIRLMQMGANYNKKMEGLKPSMKILKMLDNNQLLDEGKLSFLIDISKKDPAAIQQLLKDSGVDPLSMDLENAPKYAPGAHAVSDKEVELDQVLDEVNASPTGQRTLQTVTAWDDHSKRVLAENPQVISDINGLMANGIFDQIVSEVERRKMLGDLKNLSSLDAFKAVGDELQAKGLLQATATATTAAAEPTPAQPVATRVKAPAAETDADRAARARAAGTVKTTSAPAKQEFNLLAMSDEEFEKAAAKF